MFPPNLPIFRRILPVVAIMLVQTMACLTISAESLADEPVVAVDVSDLPDGSYVLVKAGSGVSVRPLTLLRPGTIPVPPGPTPPSVLTPRSLAIRDAALKATADPNRTKTAVNLATASSELAKRVGKDLSGYQVISMAELYLFDQLTAGPTIAAWRPTRDLIVADLAKLAQEGASDAQFAGYLGEVSAGLAASAPNSREIDMELILKILQIFIQYILPLIIK